MGLYFAVTEDERQVCIGVGNSCKEVYEGWSDKIVQQRIVVVFIKSKGIVEWNRLRTLFGEHQAGFSKKRHQAWFSFVYEIQLELDKYLKRKNYVEIEGEDDIEFYKRVRSKAKIIVEHSSAYLDLLKVIKKEAKRWKKRDKEQERYENATKRRKERKSRLAWAEYQEVRTPLTKRRNKKEKAP